MFWSKPSGGPDPIGGIFPIDFPEVRCMNRSGGTHIRGEVVQLAWQAGAATEIATNDSNSYRPGYSNDTVWNTVVDPNTNAFRGGGTLRRGTLFGVCMSDTVTDNTTGLYRFFGLIEKAFVIKPNGTTTATSCAGGMPLTVTITNSFNGQIGTNEIAVASYMDIQGTNVARRLRRVLLHNGFLATPQGGVTANS